MIERLVFRLRRVSTAAGLAAVLAAPAVAQEVRGTALEAGADRPLAEAFVSLVGDSGPVASTLTGSDGAFLLVAPAAGTYRLRVERIGYETWTTEPFALAAGESVSRRVEVPVAPVDVSELRVAVESRCGRREGAGERLLAAWEEVRKALDVARWTHEPDRIRYEVRVWERQLDVTGRRVRRERDETAWKTGAVSFASLSPEDLAADGYVRREGDGWEFYAPDAPTLLSDSFREEHCFRLVPGVGPTAGLVGLAFEPTDLTDPEVEGTLWLDPATGELRHLAFEYVGLELVGYPREGKATGRVEYRRLPPGIWLVARWRIRMPELGRRDASMLRPEAVIEHGLGIVERGGEITRLELASGEPLELTERGTVAGRIGDQVTGGPLAEAAVYLAGTGHTAFTDAAGRFRFDLVPPGTYTLRARHPDPRLDGLEAPPHLVEVRGGETTSLWLDFPAAWAAERLCGGAGDAERPDDDAARAPVAPGGPGGGTAALLGRVVSEDGSGVPGAVVWVAGAEAAAEPRAFQADSTGTFLLCGLAPGPVALQAAAEGLLSDTVRVELRARALALHDLALAAPAVAVAAPAGESDLTALRGTVRSAETGEPVAGARVALVGSGLERVTGEDGTFFLPDVPRGRHRLVTEHLGLASDTVEVDLTHGTVQVAVLTLDTRPIALPTLDVEIERTFANPRLAGFYDRMERGLGDFITKEDLETGDVIANFRRIPSVRIDQCVNDLGSRVGGCWDLKITRGALGGRSLIEGTTTDRCPPLLYVDGQLLPGTDVEAKRGRVYGSNSFTFLQQYPRDRIEGIEIYRSPAAAPAQYRMLGDACGIILVWTRGRGG